MDPNGQRVGEISIPIDDAEIPWSDKWLKNKKKQVFREVTGSRKITMPYTTTITTSGNHTNEERPSIFRIEGQRDAEVACIGVFAKRDNYFSTDDNNKWLCVGYLSQWLGLKQTVCLEEITRSVTLARSYYKELPILDDQTFVDSLFLDGCFLAFMIALLQSGHDSYGKILKGDGLNHQRNEEYYVLYQETMQKKMDVKLDMLKANNQIPWFVVEAVFRNSGLITPGSTTLIAKLALSCFGEFYPKVHKDKFSCAPPMDNQIKHLLHLFLWSRTSGPILVDPISGITYATETNLYIPSATDLQESSTYFKAIVGASIDFSYDNVRLSGNMHVAPLHLFRYSMEIFSNLIDFEQNFLACGLDVTSYVACMVRLLQGEDDVKILRNRGIVGNTMKTNKEVLEFMEKLRAKIVDAFIRDDLHNLSEKVMEHHERGTSRQYAELKKGYCTNRWITLSVIAGFFIFIFTAIQAVYGTLSYYKA